MPEPGALHIRRLSKRFERPGQPPLEVLKNIDLNIAPGEFVTLVGASGCGKSTLLRLIVGLDDAFDGELQLDGQPIAGTSLDRGIVFQEHRLFPWLTVRQNIGLGLLNAPLSEADKARAVQAHVDLVRLQGFEDAWPHQLSGGMAQRAAIARALVNRPRVLLLDEPFGALDALTRSHLQTELQRICATEGLTALLVTHDVDEAIFLGNRVVVLEPRPGRVRAIVPVRLPQPRERGSAAFGALRDIVRGLIGEAPEEALAEPSRQALRLDDEALAPPPSATPAPTPSASSSAPSSPLLNPAHSS